MARRNSISGLEGSRCMIRSAAITCAELDTGSGSATPWTTLRTTIWGSVGDMVSLLGTRASGRHKTSVASPGGRRPGVPASPGPGETRGGSILGRAEQLDQGRLPHLYVPDGDRLSDQPIAVLPKIPRGIARHRGQ